MREKAHFMQLNCHTCHNYHLISSSGHFFLEVLYIKLGTVLTSPASHSPKHDDDGDEIMWKLHFVALVWKTIYETGTELPSIVRTGNETAIQKAFPSDFFFRICCQLIWGLWHWFVFTCDLPHSPDLFCCYFLSWFLSANKPELMWESHQDIKKPCKEDTLIELHLETEDKFSFRIPKCPMSALRFVCLPNGYIPEVYNLFFISGK